MARRDAPQRGNRLDAHMWRPRVPAVEGPVNSLAHAALGHGLQAAPSSRNYRFATS